MPEKCMALKPTEAADITFSSMSSIKMFVCPLCACETAWENGQDINENSVKIDHIKSLLHCFVMSICVSRLAKWTLKLVNISRCFPTVAA
jgi:hypothetical protein